VTQQQRPARRHQSEGEKREERAQRILDAATTLLLRYGYHKTTIGDIAREAGVGKGTLYLHWNSREALFAALMLREKVAMASDIQQCLASNPAGASLRGLLKHAALSLLRRPLLKAVLLRDTQIFGAWVGREQSSSLSTDVLAGFTAYLEMLRAQGLVRTDLSVHMLAALFGSIFLGFFQAQPLLPDAMKPSEEELAELMAETGHRTLEPVEPIPSAALEIASHTLAQYLDRSMKNAQEQLHGRTEQEFENVRPTAQIVSRARGKKGGRAKKLHTAAQLAQARLLYADTTRSIQEICSELGISRATFYRSIKQSSHDSS
jgi:AcrR family transcriptional regulator